MKDPLPVSSIYAFKGKLDGKFHTSSGVFLAVNGYSNDVEDALRFGKTLNILLFEKEDIDLIFNGDVKFLDVLKFKLRQAGDTGTPRAPYILKKTAKNLAGTKPRTLKMLKSDILQNINNPKEISDILIFYTNDLEASLVKNFIKPLDKTFTITYRLEALNDLKDIKELPPLLNIYENRQKIKAIIIILSKEKAAEISDTLQLVEEQLKKASRYINAIFISISPESKKQLYNTPLSESLQAEPAFAQLENFISQIAEQYYDTDAYIPEHTMIGEMKSLEWDNENNVLLGTGEYSGMPFTIETLEDLIDHLNEAIGQSLNAEMPIDWLKEHSIDYDDDIREFLYKNYKEQLDNLGWDTDELW